jgi:hypothetical protein
MQKINQSQAYSLMSFDKYTVLQLPLQPRQNKKTSSTLCSQFPSDTLKATTTDTVRIMHCTELKVYY